MSVLFSSQLFIHIYMCSVCWYRWCSALQHGTHIWLKQGNKLKKKKTPTHELLSLWLRMNHQAPLAALKASSFQEESSGKMRLSSVSAVCISEDNHNMQHEKINRLLLSYILILYQPATRCLDNTRLFDSVPFTPRICRLEPFSYCSDVEPKCAS